MGFRWLEIGRVGSLGAAGGVWVLLGVGVVGRWGLVW